MRVLFWTPRADAPPRRDVSPASSTTLSREEAPPTMRTSGRRMASERASRSTTDSLARPRSGGAATRSFQRAPVAPDHGRAAGAG